MAEEKEDSKTTLAGYLRDNDWEKELNYKLWGTKGARFCAAKRLDEMDDSSTKSLTFLSAYLIIIGLFPVFFPSLNEKLPSQVLGLSTVGISILVLVYSLIESTRKYAVRSRLYHQCALRIGRLYDALRQAKGIDSEKTKDAQLQRITKKYERTIAEFENHEPIDFELFQTQKPEYFKLSRFKIFSIKLRAYYHAQFRYHVLIIVPPLLIALLSCYTLKLEKAPKQVLKEADLK